MQNSATNLPRAGSEQNPVRLNLFPQTNTMMGHLKPGPVVYEVHLRLDAYSSARLRVWISAIQTDNPGRKLHDEAIWYNIPVWGGCVYVTEGVEWMCWCEG